MAWNTLQPIAKTGRPMVSAGVHAIGRTGALRLGLNFAAMFHDELGAPERCNIEVGDGENLGMLRLSFAKDGAFSIGKSVAGSRRIFLTPVACMPPGALPTVAAKIVEHDKKALTIALPLDAWTAAVEARTPARAAHAEPPPRKARAARAAGPARRGGLSSGQGVQGRASRRRPLEPERRNRSAAAHPRSGQQEPQARRSAALVARPDSVRRP